MCSTCSRQAGQFWAIGETLQREEGVVLALADAAIREWKEAGEQWKVWSSQLVSVRLKTRRKKKTTCFSAIENQKEEENNLFQCN